jgi:hypothetical protein
MAEFLLADFVVCQQMKYMQQFVLSFAKEKVRRLSCRSDRLEYSALHLGDTLTFNVPTITMRARRILRIVVHWRTFVIVLIFIRWRM